MRSRHVDVVVHLDQVRASAEAIRRTTGVSLIAVIKADAYGLGAARVADALAGAADDFAYFSLHEAREVGRPGLVIGPPVDEASEYRELGLRPALASLADAARFRGMPVAVSVDTGMQRFGCPREQVAALLAACDVREVLTHASDAAAAQRLLDVVPRGRYRMHAASTALLGCAATWLDAVRPGYALYRGAVRVSTRLVGVRDTRGPAGYTGFSHPRIGIILAGYANGLTPAAVLVNGRRQRLLEIGMNSSFVSVDPHDRDGDEVVLLGDTLSEQELAAELRVRPHEVLCRYTAMGPRRYVAGEAAKPHDSAVGATAGEHSTLVSRPR